MTAKSKTAIKLFFETGDVPSQSQFGDLIDSYVDAAGPVGNLETIASAGNVGFIYTSGKRYESLNAAQSLVALGATVVTTSQAINAVAGTYTTSAQVSSMAVNDLMATTVQAVSGLATGVLMNPVLVKNAIAAQAAALPVLYSNIVASAFASALDISSGTASKFIDAAGLKSSKFTSTQQTISAAGTLTIAHGLGAVPFGVSVEAVCQTAENGYSIGDVLLVPIAPSSTTSTSGQGYGISITKDSTNIKITFGSHSTASLIATNKSTGDNVGLTDANWKLVVRAWL